MSHMSSADIRDHLNTQFGNLPAPTPLNWFECLRRIFFIAKNITLYGMLHGLLREFGPLGWATFADTQAIPIEDAPVIEAQIAAPPANAAAGVWKLFEVESERIKLNNSGCANYRTAVQYFMAKFSKYLGPSLQQKRKNLMISSPHPYRWQPI